MQDIRHLNLFEKITRIQTRFSFKYNDTLIFGVPKPFLLQAIGRDSENLRKIHGILKTRVKVVPLPKGIEDLKIFVERIVAPVKFKEIEVIGDDIVLTAGSESKAALIGRNKRRLLEMQKIIADYFSKGFRII